MHYPHLHDLALLCERSYGNRGVERFGEEAILVVRRKNLTVVAIRGSDSPEDWASNYDVAGEAGAHAGFVAGGKKLLDRVAELVLEDGGRRDVLLVGHSRGGALAEYIGAYLLLPTVTFGAPRVFERRYLRSLEKTRDLYLPQEHQGTDTVRCVAPGDPIPFVPLTTIGYRHRTKATLLTKRGATKRPSFLGAVVSTLWKIRGSRRAHSIQNYVALAARVQDPTDKLTLAA